MLPLGILDQFYVVSSGVGLAYLSITLVMGRVGRGGGGHSHGGLGHGGHGLGHGLGHGGHAAGGQGLGHGGHAAGGHGLGQGGHAAGGQGLGHGGHAAGGNGLGHAGAQAGHGPAHAGAGGHGGAAGTGSGASQSDILDVSLLSTQAARQSTSLHIHVPGQGANSIGMMVLELLNPMVIAVFLTFFGIAGLAAHTLVPVLGLITLAPAAVCGYFSARAFTSVLHWMFDHLEISSEAKVQDMVGLAANVCVPISNNRPGEITYVIESKRLNSPAKSLTPNLDFAKGSKVMICEVRDNIAFVEPWHELYEPTV